MTVTRTTPPATRSPSDVPARAGVRDWLALAVLFLPTLLVAVDNTVLGFALPAISRALRPDAPTLLWIVDVYPLVLAGLLIAMGGLGDRIGRRRLLLVGIAGFGAVSLLAALAADGAHLVAARAALGFFGAMLMPSVLAILRTVFVDRTRRRLALAIWATAFAAGAALGPIVGALLLEHFWWGSVFLVNVPVAVLVLLAAPLVLPESRMAHPGRRDLGGVALSMLATVPAVLAIHTIGERGFTAASVVELAVGVTAGVLFVRRCRALPHRGRTPLIDLGLFASPVVRVSVLANATTMFALTGLLFFAAQYLQLVLGRSPLEAGLVLVPGMVATILAGLGAAGLARRFPLRVLVPAGLVLAAAGYVLCTRLGVGSAETLLLLAAVLIGAGIGLSETITNDAILAAAPADRAGAASAVGETAYELGAVLGTAVLGSVLSAVYRAAVEVPAEAAPGVALGSEASETARQTLGGAVDVAAGLPGPAADALLGSARTAFSLGVDVTAGVGTAALLLVALTVVLGLRRRS
ncbi:MFS transporter [Pseudonocardia kujensis]|uniref:MFS transporter n=1 Tax=Pseudonocardia kujensis TaxID=1128675 RepID=UPI001E62F0D8|nr:MFS transporter [Pseudonocardia kujensis]MCE0765334.1 MFS transporter [Pseudonocardia kujensis]